MSKGPGHIQRKLIELLTRNAKPLFSTEDLCSKVFRVRQVRKKHRVAVLRALKRIAKTKKVNVWRAISKMNRNDFCFDYSRAPARRKPLPNPAPALKDRPRK